LPHPISLLVAAGGAALILVAPAAAHVVASPAFLSSGATETIELSVPNERDTPMASFVVTAPAGLEIVQAEESEGWNAAVEGTTATWSGGSLPAKLSETFGLRVMAIAEPGALDLDAEQRYADGTVRWPVTLTIVPGTPSSDAGSSSLVVVVIVGVGLLVTTAIVLLARRRRKSLQEG
jgi:LPXTG-motif cell wall-anchored protein